MRNTGRARRMNKGRGTEEHDSNYLVPAEDWLPVKGDRRGIGHADDGGRQREYESLRQENSWE